MKMMPDAGLNHHASLIGAGNFKDEVAIPVGGSTNEQAPPVEQLDLGFKNGSFLLGHLQRKVGPAAVDFLGRDLQPSITRQGHHA